MAFDAERWLQKQGLPNWLLVFLKFASGYNLVFDGGIYIVDPGRRLFLYLFFRAVLLVFSSDFFEALEFWVLN